MPSLPCPHCGPRDAGEFSLGGPGDRVRPADPGALDDAAWADFVHNRTNPEGPGVELWYHAAGCRRWIRIERDTLSHKITGARDATRS